MRGGVNAKSLGWLIQCNKDAKALPGRNPSLRFQSGDGFAHHSPANTEHARHGLLRRKSIAWTVMALNDFGAQRLSDTLRQTTTEFHRTNARALRCHAVLLSASPAGTC